MFIFGEHEEMQSSEERRKGMSHGHEHKAYADQICAEAEVEEMVRGMLVRKWRNLSKENHFLDASYYSCVGASVRGIKIQMAGSAVSRASGTVPAGAVSERSAMSSRPTAREVAARSGKRV